VNELEWVKGEIYANVWQTIGSSASIAQRPSAGLINVRDIGPATTSTTDAVLKRIAYDAKRDRLFVTGKNWPKLFEIRLRPRSGPPRCCSSPLGSSADGMPAPWVAPHPVPVRSPLLLAGALTARHRSYS